jgi:Flp pilus assembly protein TadD
MTEKRYGQAASAYATAFSMQKTRALLVKLHGALRSAGSAAAADSVTAEWLRDHPDDNQVRYLVADTAIRNQNLQLAAEQYQHALKNEPNQLPVLHNLGWVYERLNDPRALDVAETAHKIAPDNPAVLHDLSRLLIEKGDAKRAIELLEKARLLSPESQLIRYNLARAYVKNGNNGLARMELQQVLRGQPFPERPAAEELFKQLSK